MWSEDGCVHWIETAEHLLFVMPIKQKHEDQPNSPEVKINRTIDEALLHNDNNNDNNNDNSLFDINIPSGELSNNDDNYNIDKYVTPHYNSYSIS